MCVFGPRHVPVNRHRRSPLSLFPHFAPEIMRAAHTRTRSAGCGSFVLPLSWAHLRNGINIKSLYRVNSAMSVAAVFDVRVSMLSCVFIEIKRRNACCRQPTLGIDSPAPIGRSANHPNERFICRRLSERRRGSVCAHFACAENRMRNEQFHFGRSFDRY